MNCNKLEPFKLYTINNTNSVAVTNSALNYPHENGTFFLAILPTLGDRSLAQYRNGLVYIAINRDSGNIYVKLESNGNITTWRLIQ